ncbi:MAG: hypothetical protein WBV94_20800 [Blastocatellia bacterium]
MSAIDQGYRYAINLPCDWIIVISMRQMRLYHRGSDQYTYERFDTEKLANDNSLLRKFVFLLKKKRARTLSLLAFFDLTYPSLSIPLTVSISVPL